MTSPAALYLQDAHPIAEGMDYVRYAESKGFEAVWQADSRLVRDAIVVDGPGLFIGLAICAALLLAACVTDQYLRREDIDGPEIYGLYLMAAVGGLVMACVSGWVSLSK